MKSLCPITKTEGRLLRVRQPEELFASYESYLGAPFPVEFKKLYFNEPIHEFESDAGGLRWYTPNLLGDGDYYAALSRTYPGYYNPGSWDKLTLLEVIADLKAAAIVEVGSGDGWLLDRLRERKLSAFGIDINETAVKRCRERGLKAFLPGEIGMDAPKGCVLCLLQTIEHVSNPLEFLKKIAEEYQPDHIVLSAPCFEAVLGHTKDPLVWPPHHFTAWSEKSFRVLAAMLGFEVALVKYSPLTLEEFNQRLRQEDTRKLWKMPYIPNGLLGRIIFKAAAKLGIPWACRSHSILVVLKKKR